jgi:DNA mismatch repair ATPase MutL
MDWNVHPRKVLVSFVNDPYSSGQIKCQIGPLYESNNTHALVTAGKGEETCKAVNLNSFIDVE